MGDQIIPVAATSCRADAAERELNAKMARNQACVLCHTPVVDSVLGTGGYRICLKCDLAWSLDTEPVTASGDWKERYYGRADIVQLHERRQSGMNAIVKRLSELHPHRGLLLDVGTGVGIFMSAAAKDDWRVEGIEPSSIAAERARKLTGARVYNDIFENVKLSEGRYDAVCIIDTLRHVPEPRVFLSSARRLIRPGGILLIREFYQRIWQYYRRLWRKPETTLRSQPRSQEYAQCFSPKSLLYALDAIGLDGWIEPSPIFVESDCPYSMFAFSKRVAGLASRSVYRISGHRICISPNVLAIGRAPSENTTRSVSTR